MNQAKGKIPVLLEDRMSGMEDKVGGLDQISKEFEKKIKITREMLGHTGDMSHRGEH